MEKFYKTCMTCDARLTSDEKAIYMKLVIALLPNFSVWIV